VTVGASRSTFVAACALTLVGTGLGRAQAQAIPDDPYVVEAGPESDADSAADAHAEADADAYADADADSDADADAESEADAEPHGLPKALFYGALVVTLLTAGVGAYFGFQALTVSASERGRDPRLPADVSGITELALIADVLYGTALAFAAATVAIALFTDWTSPSPPTPARVAPVLGPGLAGVAVEGSF
jgi:hypothetical protein